MLESLPAVFRDAVQGDFLAEFLSAFEAVQDRLEREVDLLPSLFSLAPTPTLRDESDAGTRSLYLDSATGICDGDVIQIGDALQRIGDRPRAVEFGTVQELRGTRIMPVAPRKDAVRSLLPTIVRLRERLRFEHLTGAPVRIVGTAAASGALADAPAVPQDGRQLLAVRDLDVLDLRPGAVVRIGEEPIDYAQVVAVAPAAGTVTIAPPLPPARHGAGTRVTAMEPAATTAPLADFAFAERAGPELLIEAPARRGDSVLHLDSHSGIYSGALLQTLEDNVLLREVVRVRRRAPGQYGAARLRAGLRLAVPLRRDHAAGTSVRTLVPTGATGELSDAAEEGATELSLTGLDLDDLAPEDVLRVGSSDYVDVAELTADRVRLRTPLRSSHAARVAVRVLKAPSGGTVFLGWLAALIALELREDRGERFNRELTRAASLIWRWRGTRLGIEAFLQTYVRGQARAGVTDPSNPMQLGFISTLGVDTVPCGRPNFFWADLWTDARNPWMYDPRGLAALDRAAHDALGRERPAHTFYNLRLHARTMQLATDAEDHVGSRLGETTLLWDEPLVTAPA